MTKQITFVTGNPNKAAEAKIILADYGISVVQLALDIDEIQAHDPLKITKAKAWAAYAQAGVPIVVNDSSWEIPALGGFPGGYMKDVVQWFTAEDFLNLMRDKDDRQIILHDTVASCDGSNVKMFVFRQIGEFIDAPRGEGLSMSQVVTMQNSGGLTIAEEFARRQKDAKLDPQNFQHWQQFGEWFKEQ